MTGFMKWFCRIGLLVILAAFSYVVTRPSYNFAHWIPHNLMRSVGFNYSEILWFEQNADIVLHFMGAFMITALLIRARIPMISQPRVRAFLFVFTLCVAAEGVQYIIGRGIETSDLALGISGSFMAYLALNKIK